MQQVLDNVLQKIKPDLAETKKFQRITTQFLKKLKLTNAKPILGGSGEKDTWLSDSHDVDIFVLYDPKKFKDVPISDLLEADLKKSFPKIKRLHGSRDYFQIIFQTYLFEIVPILKIQKAKEAQNITDISPLHAKWIKKSSKKIRDEIRLAKAFAKANNCYGAESFISGFSGYVLEIMTIYYGSFLELLQAATTWENRDIIDIEKHYSGIGLFKKINSSKLKSPLIVVDPVDKSRNAAAALNMEKFFLFREKAQQFIQQPQLSFFEKQTLSYAKLEKDTLYNLVYLEITPLPGKDDVVGTKLLKAFQFLKKKFKDFEVQEANWDWNRKSKAIFYYILERRQIEPYTIRQGPPLKFEDAVKAFKKKNKDTYQERGRLMTKIPFAHYQLKNFVKFILKNPYFKERIKAVKTVKIG